MTGFIEDDVLHFEGLNDQDIANINAVIPIVLHLIKVYDQEKANIQKCLLVLVPIVRQILAKQTQLKG